MTLASDLPFNAEIFPDADALVFAASGRIADALRDAPGPRASLCLSGGSTPKRVYEHLAESDLDWTRIHLFWGDERLVGPDHPDSNERMAREALVSRVAIPPGNVHPIVTSGHSALEAASDYEDLLRGFYAIDALTAGIPLFDVTLLGLGEDGHTASLFPGSPALDDPERWAAPVPDAGQPPYVPRVTLTRPALAASRLTLFLVTGAAKQAPLARVAAGDPLPATLVAQDNPRATWLVDVAATRGRTA